MSTRPYYYYFSFLLFSFSLLLTRVNQVKRGKPATLQELEAALQVTVLAQVAPTRGRQRKFVTGPLDWGEICLAAKAGGAALAMWLLIHLRKRLAADSWISLPNRYVVELGVSRPSKSRALHALAREGLIRIAPSQRGQTTRVALVRDGQR